MKLHLLHQLFGQWQNLVFGTKHMVNGDATGDLIILLSLLSLSRKLDFQCQGTPLEIVLLDAPDQFEHRMIQVNGDGGILADVRFKGLLATDTLPLPLADNRPVVDASREIIEHLPHLAELLRQLAQRCVSQVKAREDSHAMHLFCSLLAYAPNLLNLQL